jgi:hypothetical protein
MHKFSLVIFALAIGLLATPLLHAQGVELYGTFSEIHANNVPSNGLACPVNVVTCVAAPQLSGINAPGVGVGATFNWVHTPFVNFGIDFRGSRHFSTNGEDTGLAGFKLSVKPKLFHATTYLQVSTGYFGTTYTPASQSANVNHYWSVVAFGGVDVPVSKRLSVRVLEAGAGHVTNSNYNVARPSFFTASSGLVYRY